jgi:DNA polymerase-3 subunit delta'
MSFKDIKGQDNSVSLLKSCMEQSRLGGSYLFSGPQGLGKGLVAKTLAKALNCLQGELDSCDECASCLKIDAAMHPDVFLVQPQGEIKIEQIRQLQKQINYKPYEAKFKVFILDNAHTLTAEASNALLKILEEPPASSLIILITDKPALIFKTILSRCKIIKFSPLRRADLQEILKVGYGLDDRMAHFLAYFCEGRIGSALTMKETDIFREKNRLIDHTFFKDMDIEGLPLHDKEGLRRYLNILSTWFRDIYLIKAGLARLQLINLDRQEELFKLSEKFSFQELNGIVDFIADSTAYLDKNINTRLLLYNLGARICRI